MLVIPDHFTHADTQRLKTYEVWLRAIQHEATQAAMANDADQSVCKTIAWWATRALMGERK